MSKKKNNKAQSKQVPLSPEKYMRTRMRSNKIEACFLSDGLEENGIAQLLVVRKHPQGTYSFAIFLVDIWCRGVVDAMYKVNVDEEDYQEYLDKLQSELDMHNVDYAYAHNLVYGALAFAEDAGIEPGKDFEIAQYMLDEDTDDSPFMELEFGRNGKYCLCLPPFVSPGKYLQALDKNIGPGNYDYILSEDSSEDSTSFYNSGQSGVYSYKHPQYPEPRMLDTLNYPDLLVKLEKDIALWPKDELAEVLSRDKDKLVKDLNLIMRVVIGETWQLMEDNPDGIEDRYTNIPIGTMLLLGEVGSEKDVETVFELLRQSSDYLDYFLGDDIDDSVGPVVYKLCRNNFGLIDKFMREPGLYWYPRSNVITSFVGQCYSHEPEKRDELIDLVSELTKFYIANQNDTSIWDGGLSAFMIDTFQILKATECIPLVEELYATGKIDEGVYGDIEDAIYEIENGKDVEDRLFPLPLLEWVDVFKDKWYKENK